MSIDADQKGRRGKGVSNVPNLNLVSESSSPKNPTQDLRTKVQAANIKNVLFSQFAPEKTLARCERLQRQLLENKELIARDGCLGAIWKTYRGKRLGPYYRVEFRLNRTTRTIYIGRDEELVKMVREMIDELKQSRREDRLIRQARTAARAALRRSLAETEVLAAPFGYRRRAFRFCKRRQ